MATSVSANVDVSIIVPFFNAEPYIERCIHGLLAQEFDPARYEVLMVDNNSTDRSAEIVRHHPRVRLLREGKQGAYAARNRGLAEARGQLVVFTDPDCVPERAWLRLLLAPFADPAVQVVNGRTTPASSSRLLTLLAAYEHHRDSYIFESSDPTLYFGHTNNLGTRREVIEGQGRFLERARGADAIFVRQVVDRFGCAAARYVPEARVLHLEIDSLAAYFRKIPIYRVSRDNYSRVAFKRAPGMRERLRILRRAVASGDIPLHGLVPAFVLLAAGVAYGRLGGATERAASSET